MQEAITPGVVLKRMEGFRVAYVPHHGVYGDIGLASAMGTIYLVAMLLVATLAIAAIWRPGSGR